MFPRALPRGLSPRQKVRLCFFWFFALAEMQSEGGRVQGAALWGVQIILICNLQPLLDIGNPLQLPSALNVAVNNDCQFLFTSVGPRGTALAVARMTSSFATANSSQACPLRKKIA